MAKPYHHVLIATDLAKQSNQVAKHAHALATAMGAKLSIAHVLMHAPIAYAGEFSIPIDAEFEETMTKQAAKKLAQQSKKYQIAEKAQHLLQGSVKCSITDLAQKIKASLIVVGTHGHGGLDFLLGSQANAILHATKCDVLVVRIK